MRVIKEVVDGKLIEPEGQEVSLPISDRAVPKPEKRKKKKGLDVNRNFAELPDGRVVLAGVRSVGQKDEEGYKDETGIA